MSPWCREVPVVQVVKITVARPQAQLRDGAMDTPVVLQGELSTVQTARKYAQIPQVQSLGKLVDVPMVTQRQVPTRFRGQRAVNVPTEQNTLVPCTVQHSCGEETNIWRERSALGDPAERCAEVRIPHACSGAFQPACPAPYVDHDGDVPTIMTDGELLEALASKKTTFTVLSHERGGWESVDDM